jgi:NifU-like protein involved in Fe-S cluster formation
MCSNEGSALELASYGYRPAAIINYVTPRNEGTLKDADSRGYASSPADDEHLELSLQVDPDLTVTKARFRAVGNPALVAAGSIVTQLVQNNSLKVAVSLTPEDLDYALGRLPSVRRYATKLAVTALRQAALRIWEQRQPVPRQVVA